MNKTLADWLAYLETLHPKTIDLSLERIKIVAEKLALLPWRIPTITVSGTNGKGSCVVLLESLYATAGYRVGTYTSPHLFYYNERVRVEQKEVSDEELCEAFSCIEKNRGGISLTYFEFGTLAALWIFKNKLLDMVILEVGLGGRLDAVNIVDADIAIIASIDIDHTEFLGADREAIGYEKAGIMRPFKPCVCGDQKPPTSLLDYSKKIQSNLYCLERDFFYEDHSLNANTSKELKHLHNNFTWMWWNHHAKFIQLPIPSVYLDNAATVLQVVDLLQNKFLISLDTIKKALAAVFIPGRQQVVVENNITIIFDVAHNPHAARLLAQKCRQQKIIGKTYAVFAMLKDKDIAATADCLHDIVDFWLVASIDNARGASAKQINSSLEKINISSVAEFVDVKSAFAQSKILTKPNDRIIVFGSFYTVAAVMR